MQPFRPYAYDPHFSYDSGWDKYALKYATLLQPDTLYYLHKQVMYDYLDKHIFTRGNNSDFNILDVNCGTGNDFPYLLSKGCVTGIDGSAGMLNKAAELYNEARKVGKLVLYQGMLEHLQEGSLDNRRYDLVYSITGGFSYINDEQFTQAFRVLKTMLKPGGVMVTAHLNSFCLSETIACIMKGRFRRSLVRLKNPIPTADGGFMYLRSRKALHRLLSPVFTQVDFFPLICIAPPYQTDVQVSVSTYNRLRRIENVMTGYSIGSAITDQAVAVCR